MPWCCATSPPVTCGGCNSSSAPSEQTVTVAGVPDGVLGAASSSVVNGTWTLAFLTSGYNLTTDCEWSMAIPAAPCGGCSALISLDVNYNAGTNTTTIGVAIALLEETRSGIVNAGNICSFTLTRTGKVDCFAFSDLNLPADSGGNPGGACTCHVSS
jgi:hypothetical protein